MYVYKGAFYFYVIDTVDSVDLSFVFIIYLYTITYHVYTMQVEVYPC